MEKSVPQAKRIDIPLTGSWNQVAAPNQIPIEDAAYYKNWRLSRDGTRIERFLGSSISVNAIGSYDVCGYGTYYNVGNNFCQIAVTQEKLWRKIADGDWSDLYAFSSTLDQPVNILDLEGRQFVVNIEDNRQIHTDGNDYTIGIAAPTTLPTATTTAQDETTYYIDEDCADFSTPTWVDEDNNSTSTQTSTPPSGGTGPEGDDEYFRFQDDGTPAAGEYAQRTATITGLPQEFSIETALYFEDWGFQPQGGETFLFVFTGIYQFTMMFCGSYVWYLNNTGGWSHAWTPPGEDIRDAWYTFKFRVTEDTIAMYVNGVHKGTFNDANNANTDNTGEVSFKVKHENATYGNPDVWVDYIKMWGKSESGSTETGIRRYAVTFARSGNYGAESNPIKSHIGTPSFTGTGSGLTLTPEGTYTGTETKTYRLEVVSVAGGAPTEYKVSSDGGTTWNVGDDTNPLPWATEMTLLEGINLSVSGSASGYIVGDYWDITCSVCSATMAGESVTLSSIPTDSNSANTGTDQRKIYRTTIDGQKFFWLANIDDNTTTTFVDNIPDELLGELMEQDHDVCPNSYVSEYWDDRLWVAEDRVIYYSRIDEPEHFDTSRRYIKLKYGRSGEDIQQIKAYKDALYVFTTHAIFIIEKKASGGYSRRLLYSGLGCPARWSVIEVNGLLMFLSHRGWEIFNGVNIYPTEFSYKIYATINSRDYSNLKLITTTHLRERGEVWLSIPHNESATVQQKVVVYNYRHNTFHLRHLERYTSRFISCLAEARDSDDKMQNYAGLDNGNIILLEDGQTDNSTEISAVYRKAWIDLGQKCMLVRGEVTYDLPEDKEIELRFYADMQKDIRRSIILTGNTPSTSDSFIRVPIKEDIEIGFMARYLSIAIRSTDDPGDDVRVNSLSIWVKPKVRKGRIAAD